MQTNSTSGLLKVVEEPRGPRPTNLIVASIVGLAGSMVVGCAMYWMLNPFQRSHPRETVIVWSIFFALEYWLLRALFRGANWVRWFFVIDMVSNVVMFTRNRYRYPEDWQLYLYVAQCVICAIAIGLLFLPASNRWFGRDG